MKYWPLICLPLIGCSNNNPPPPPQGWFLQYSVGGSIVQKTGGFTVTFPASNSSCPGPLITQGSNCPQIDYIVHSGKWTGTFNVSGTVTGGPFDFHTQQDGNAGTAPANCRPYFQRAFDNLTDPTFRWWSNPITVVLNPGTFQLSVPLTPDHWSDVNGQMGSDNQTAFNAAVSNMGAYGMTCGGGSFFGHGVNGAGTLSVTLQ